MTPVQHHTIAAALDGAAGDTVSMDVRITSRSWRCALTRDEEGNITAFVFEVVDGSGHIPVLVQPGAHAWGYEEFDLRDLVRIKGKLIACARTEDSGALRFVHRVLDILSIRTVGLGYVLRTVRGGGPPLLDEGCRAPLRDALFAVDLNDIERLK
ncbi:MAG: hypothetical protein ACYC99_08945 [Candidatus Geothermincolia bacterium]